MPSTWRIVLTIDIEGDITRVHDRLGDLADLAEESGGFIVGCTVDRLTAADHRTFSPRAGASIGTEGGSGAAGDSDAGLSGDPDPTPSATTASTGTHFFGLTPGDPESCAVCGGPPHTDGGW